MEVVALKITDVEAQKKLLTLIEHVNKDNAAVRIASDRGDVVLLSAAEYFGLQETAYLFRSPASTRRLLDAYDQAVAGNYVEHELGRG